MSNGELVFDERLDLCAIIRMDCDPYDGGKVSSHELSIFAMGGETFRCQLFFQSVN